MLTPIFLFAIINNKNEIACSTVYTPVTAQIIGFKVIKCKDFQYIKYSNYDLNNFDLTSCLLPEPSDIEEEYTFMVKDYSSGNETEQIALNKIKELYSNMS